MTKKVVKITEDKHPRLLRICQDIEEAGRYGAGCGEYDAPPQWAPFIEVFESELQKLSYDKYWSLFHGDMVTIEELQASSPVLTKLGKFLDEFVEGWDEDNLPNDRSLADD